MFCRKKKAGIMPAIFIVMMGMKAFLPLNYLITNAIRST